jgi:hypothetical protein
MPVLETESAPGALSRREFFRRLTAATFPAAGGAGGADFPDFENCVTCDMGDLPGQEPPSPLLVMYMDRHRTPRCLRVTEFTDQVLRKILGKIKREVKARARRAWE